MSAEASTIIAAPIEVVYQAASDLARYPLFMVATREVIRLRDDPLTFRWVARSGFLPRSADVELIECAPNERLAWRSRPRAANEGQFVLAARGDQTHVTLRWTCPAAAVAPERAVSQSLANFKRAVETGQWRRRPPDPQLVVWLSIVALAVLCGAAGISAYRHGRHHA